MFVYVYERFITNNVNSPKYMTPILLMIGIPFLVLLFNNLFNQCVSISANLTLFQMFRKEYIVYSRGSCLNNWEDVFGPKKYLLFWFLPVPLPLISDGFDYHAQKDPNNQFCNYEFEYGHNSQNKNPELPSKDKDSNNRLFDPLLFINPTRNRNI